MAIRYIEKAPEPVRPPTVVKPSRKGIGGRPKKDDAKRLLTVRVDADLYDYYTALGPDWRLRINEALRKAAGL